MRIRSVTIGANVSYPLEADSFHSFGEFAALARTLFENAGLELQTVRLATQPFPQILQGQGPDSAVPFAQELERLCQAHGVDYCSIGTVVATREEDVLPYVDVIPAVIRQTEMAFASALVASPVSGINLAAIASAAVSRIVIFARFGMAEPLPGGARPGGPRAALIPTAGWYPPEAPAASRDGLQDFAGPDGEQHV